MRRFAEFWVHESDGVTCCLTATDEALDEDPDLYQGCDECPIAEAIDGLDARNHEAWRLYQRLVTKFSLDTKTVPLLMEWELADLTPEERAEVLDRFEILHDVLCPQAQPPET